MPRRHQRKFFASPIGTATPNQFTHCKAPNQHARKTSTQNLRSSYWHSYPKRNLHTTSRQTRIPGKHQRKIFAPNDTKAYIRPGADTRLPRLPRKSNGKAVEPKTTPKRTSDPVQMQAPGLPHKSSGRCNKSHACIAKAAAERRSPKRRQKVHRTPSKCSMVHNCHAKAAAKRRSPKQPHSIHRTPCRCSQPHACHAKVLSFPGNFQNEIWTVFPGYKIIPRNSFLACRFARCWPFAKDHRLKGKIVSGVKSTASETIFLFFPQTALELNGVLNSFKKQALFHHHFLVPARVPGLVSLLFWHPVPSSFPGSG